jgi:hypothetical protein
MKVISMKKEMLFIIHLRLENVSIILSFLLSIETKLNTEVFFSENIIQERKSKNNDVVSVEISIQDSYFQSYLIVENSSIK